MVVIRNCVFSFFDIPTQMFFEKHYNLPVFKKLLTRYLLSINNYYFDEFRKF